MPRINLLPWREELRKQRQKNFGIAAAVAVALAAGAVWYVHAFYAAQIDQQRRRNEFLQAEIKKLDAQITEIQELQSTRDRLIARMQIIDQLQRSRPEIVHLFDELVRTLPEGVFLNSIKQTGDRILIKGVAQSSTRVSNYMRQLEASEWFRDPGLNIVETVPGTGGRDAAREFTIFVTQVTSENSGDDQATADAS